MTLANITCFWWYQGLHAFVIGRPREPKLYRVDNTGTLPSVSPLKTHKAKHKSIVLYASIDIRAFRRLRDVDICYCSMHNIFTFVIRHDTLFIRHDTFLILLYFLLWFLVLDVLYGLLNNYSFGGFVGFSCGEIPTQILINALTVYLFVLLGFCKNTSDNKIASRLNRKKICHKHFQRSKNTFYAGTNIRLETAFFYQKHKKTDPESVELIQPKNSRVVPVHPYSEPCSYEFLVYRKNWWFRIWPFIEYFYTAEN